MKCSLEHGSCPRMTASPLTVIVVLTGYTELEYAHAALAAGAAGYLLKDASPGQVEQAIRQAARGACTSIPPCPAA